MQIAKWGGSLAICLPVSVVEALELQEGDEIEIIVDGPRLFTVRKKPGLQTRLGMV
ncbi:AbrB/MazE/SpoVT family DNA-binding domain-containing protein [Xanthomonas citri]|uniref:AbrB/MazE/SpoVT family DNA-binding domain-containing protein n=1 Tax=Xanthomonas citri TaxID=346 RepID=UPI0009BBC6D9|nr:AbrB/MazE/SpoVT family DNA-binding domain-containing protein [Xanthomonas citri]ATS68629.1 AbrB/MazE/SpoVT family DNA-binding domain-containing protein [Xanthomonas citri pv. phaseoli var. fuscans]QTK98008.1 AbrB/MazE/SpoVT family DNA-binding domain-containing protein [Xanthomonas citri pv. fuscans]